MQKTNVTTTKSILEIDVLNLVLEVEVFLNVLDFI